jgi:hypothetical protein
LIDDWTKEEYHLDNANTKELNTIFTIVGYEEFKHVSACRVVKDTWDILQTVYEGISTVRMLKIQILTAAQFEELKISDHETVVVLGNKLRDIVNQAFQLGEQHSKKNVES